jgi:hypothetical protein
LYYLLIPQISNYFLFSDMLPLLDYIITYTDEKLTSDERYYIAVLAITGGIPDPLPPGVLAARRQREQAVNAVKYP